MSSSFVEIGSELSEIVDFGYIFETRHEKPEDLLFSSHIERPGSWSPGDHGVFWQYW